MKTALLAAAAATLMATAAAAQDTTPSWYVRGDAGATFDSQITHGNGVRSDEGWGVGVGAGREFGNGFRAETQFLYLNNDGKRGAGDTRVVSGFVNGYYDFLRGGPIQPFVGGGVGVANVQLDDHNGVPGGNHTAFAYQVGAGLAHPFTDRLIGEVAYRYIGAPGVKWTNTVGRVDGDYSTSLVTVGLRYRF